MTFATLSNLVCRATVAAGLMLAMPGLALAAPQPVIGLTLSGQPSTVTLTGVEARVPGFRSALWGMTVDEVRAAAAKDFGGARASVPVTDPLTGNTAIIVPMQSLAPAPGPAAISYVFAAESNRLIHVNLDWTMTTPTPAQRSAVLEAGSTTLAGFLGNQWRLGSVVRGVVVQPDLIVLFAGADQAGGGVDVRVGGVPYALGSGKTLKTVHQPSGPATLHVGFSAPTSATVTDTIKPGAF
jgi:hypothetical protein